MRGEGRPSLHTHTHTHTRTQPGSATSPPPRLRLLPHITVPGLFFGYRSPTIPSPPNQTCPPISWCARQQPLIPPFPGHPILSSFKPTLSSFDWALPAPPGLARRPPCPPCPPWPPWPPPPPPPHPPPPPPPPPRPPPPRPPPPPPPRAAGPGESPQPDITPNTGRRQDEEKRGGGRGTVSVCVLRRRCCSCYLHVACGLSEGGQGDGLNFEGEIGIVEVSLFVGVCGVPRCPSAFTRGGTHRARTAFGLR